MESHLAQLAVEYREFHDGHIWMSTVTLLVDGEERLANLGTGGYVGLSPRDLAEQARLLDPGVTPGEVTLYRCDCGELGCGAVVARCYQLRDRIVWDQFATGNPPPRDLTAPSPAEDAMTFGADVYQSAMTRISELAGRHPD